MSDGLKDRSGKGLRPFKISIPVKRHQGIHRIMNLLLKPDRVKLLVPLGKFWKFQAKLSGFF